MLLVLLGSLRRCSTNDGIPPWILKPCGHIFRAGIAPETPPGCTLAGILVAGWGAWAQEEPRTGAKAQKGTPVVVFWQGRGPLATPAVLLHLLLS